MNLQHINIKLFVDGELQIDLQRLIETFHTWVGQQSRDELLIDVADYRHVPQGPSIVLVGHEADYALDNMRGRYGLVYNRKASLDGDNAGRIRQALASVASAATLLEEEFSDFRFDRSQLELSVNDRALAPNTDETFQACQQELVDCLSQLLGSSCDLKHENADPRHTFRVGVTTSQPFDLGKLTVV